ncbi:hypothetical protein A4X09_0g5387 [Tilletia walkeri]|uniref:Uncharacterized protein n=1 Tax=Tilletia walkeri TaxID=117179 RepID=A0A8X7N4I5_9BASI|nr:hypothetical protein A4X09_0g5387 [Tilletia walkeri]
MISSMQQALAGATPNESELCWNLIIDSRLETKMLTGYDSRDGVFILAAGVSAVRESRHCSSCTPLASCKRLGCGGPVEVIDGAS